jgi:hypothetical protein
MASSSVRAFGRRDVLLRRVAGLPESPVRDGEASRQLQATPLGFRAKSGQLRIGLHRCGEDDGHEVDEIPVAG